MKKKVLTQEALLNLYPEGETPEVKGEEVVKEQEIPVDEPIKAEESEIETEASEEVPEESVEDLKAQLEIVNRDFEDFKLKATEAEEAVAAEHTEALEKVNAVNEQLKEIVCDQTCRFRIAMNMAKVDLSDMSSENVIKEFRHAEEQFKKLPVGSVVPEPKVEKKETKAEKSSHDVSAMKSLGF